jgi:hypothetical protein
MAANSAFELISDSWISFDDLPLGAMKVNEGMILLIAMIKKLLRRASLQLFLDGVVYVPKCCAACFEFMPELGVRIFEVVKD